MIKQGTATTTYTATSGAELTNNAGTTLAYNAAEELTSAVQPNGVKTSYTYTPNGERASSTSTSVTSTYGYDTYGDLTSTKKGNTSVAYTVDGDGLRTSRTVGTTVTSYMWDTGVSTPLLLDDGTFSYVYGPTSSPIEQVNDATGAVQYLIHDATGSVRAVTSSTGTVVGTYAYDAYGNTTAHTGTASASCCSPATGPTHDRTRLPTGA